VLLHGASCKQKEEEKELSGELFAYFAKSHAYDKNNKLSIHYFANLPHIIYHDGCPCHDGHCFHGASAVHGSLSRHHDFHVPDQEIHRKSGVMPLQK
jgi:hypothetical protein